MTSRDILMLLALICVIVAVTTEIRNNNKIKACCRAMSLIGKRGCFKFEGKILEGKVILSEMDRPVITVAVEGEECWYIIKAKKFKPFDREVINPEELTELKNKYTGGI